MRILKDILHLFYPNLCVICENQLITHEKIICTFCKHDLPLVSFENYENNKIIDLFYGRIPIEKATSLLFYKKSSKSIIYHLKYKKNQQVGDFIGDWLGDILKNSHHFESIDCIIPVPLHSKKLQKRGYNQVTKFGERLSEILEIPFVENELIRTKFTQTQARLKGIDRFKNTQNKFLLVDDKIFENKHILLIDDVVTTGATLLACCSALLVSKGVKISIVTMAFAGD